MPERNAFVASETTSKKRGSPRRQVGQVTSHNRSKTIKVIVESLVKHPMYGKYIRTRTVCHVHDEANEARTGDTVEIAECRPYSKTKHWRLVRVVEKSRTGEAAPLSAGTEG